MKAIEFSAPIKNNQIQVPEEFENELEMISDKNIRIIMLIDEPLNEDEKQYRLMVQEQFLQGYSESDSIYDKDCNFGKGIGL
nr:hypothetical protein [Bacteroidota bacterium]